MLPLLKVRWVNDQAVRQGERIAGGSHYGVAVDRDGSLSVQKADLAYLPPEGPDLGGGGLRSGLFSNKADEGSLYCCWGGGRLAPLTSSGTREY